MEYILVNINNPKFEYDVHALVRSFFPETEVSFKDEGVMARWILTIEVGEDASTLSIEGPSVYEAKEDGFGIATCDLTGSFFALAGGDKDKNAFKLSFYKALSEFTGKTLPWGNLTGIRPTKIAMEGIEKGLSDEEIKELLYKEHLVSEGKQNLCVDIAHLEKSILDSFDYENGYSLYIGIPFCPTTCLYCSFTSFPIALWQKKMPQFMEAMKKEIRETALLMQGKHLETVYIGGGTPTSLSAELLRELLTCVRENFDIDGVREFTVEAGRPDSITPEKLAVLKEMGVDRISVNPQTMNDETLRLIGRNHTVQMLRDSFCEARSLGFTNINMDIILGLPGETEEMVKHTLFEIEKMSPDSLTVHSLAIKRASKLNQMMKTQKVDCLHNTDELMCYAAESAARMGMAPYYLYRQKNMSGNFENVGYAKENCYGLYNILIMEEKQSIVACGVGTVTKRVFPDGRIERCDNVKDVDLYISQVDEMINRKLKLFSD